MVGIVGGLIVILSSTITVVGWAGDQLRWREREYSKLTSLKAGFDVRYFEDKLGRPVFVRRSPGGHVEYTYRGHDYWAQAIARGGAVELYSVTSCDPGFQPTFDIPSGSSHVSLTLKKTSLAEVGFDDYGTYEYLLGANTYHFYDGIYGALPGHYKSYVWGVSSTCGNLDVFSAFDTDRLDRDRGSIADLPSSMASFRSEATINTFVETAPFVTLLESTRLELDLGTFHQFQLGPSTVLWRSVSPEPFPDEPLGEAGD